MCSVLNEYRPQNNKKEKKKKQKPTHLELKICENLEKLFHGVYDLVKNS